MSAGAPPSSRWLELREPVTPRRAPRARGELVRHLPAAEPLVIHDLGGGSGAMAAGWLRCCREPQHWVIHDRDEELLAWPSPIPQAGVTVEERRADITRLAPENLDGAGVVVASALLDMLTADELRRMLGGAAATDAASR